MRGAVLLFFVGAAFLVGWLIVLGRGGAPIEGAEPIADIRSDPVARGLVEPLPIGARVTETQDASLPTPTAPDDDSLPSAEPTLPSIGAVLFGELRSVDNASPIERPWIRCVGPDGEEVRVHPGDGSSYSIAGLPAGRHRVTVTSMKHHAVRKEVELGEGESTRRLDFTLRPKVVLAVRVVAPDGRPFGEAAREAGIYLYDFLPVATRKPPGDVFDEVVGSLNNTFGVGSFWQSGFFSASNLSDEFLGALTLDRDPPVHVSIVHGHQVLATQKVGSGVEEVTFELSVEELRVGLASCFVRVVDGETGEAIVGADAALNGGSTIRAPGPMDADGQIEFDDKPAGAYILDVYAEGYERLRLPLTLAAGEEKRFDPLPLDRAREVTVRAFDPDGNPAATEFCLARVTGDPADVVWDRRYVYRTEEDGVLSLPFLGSGRYALDVYGGEHLSTEIVEFRASDGEVEVHLVPRVVLAIDVADGADPGDRWDYEIRDARGYHIASYRVTSEYGRRLRLAPGAYRVRLIGPSGDERFERVELVDEAVTITVRPR